MTDSFVVDRRLIVQRYKEGQLSDRMLNAYNRPEADTWLPSPKQILPWAVVWHIDVVILVVNITID